MKENYRKVDINTALLASETFLWAISQWKLTPETHEEDSRTGCFGRRTCPPG
jgi:hypothetical protein